MTAPSDRRLVFVGVTVMAAVVLYAVWPGASTVYRAIVSSAGSAIRQVAGADAIELLGERDSYSLIPVIAVIVAAQGFGVARKLAFIAAGLLSFLLVGTMTVALDLVSPPATGTVRATGDLVFALLDVAVPVAVLVLFLGAEPTRLWRSGDRGTRVRARCPLCDTQQSDLADHVRSVHGRSALSDTRVRRRLGAAGR